MIIALLSIVAVTSAVHVLVTKAVSGYTEYGMSNKSEWTRFESNKGPRTFIY